MEGGYQPMDGNNQGPISASTIPDRRPYFSQGTLVGRYKIERVISTAGLAKEVYEARPYHPSGESIESSVTPVTLKVFYRPEDIASRRMRANVETAGGIENILGRELEMFRGQKSHPNIARILDYGAFPHSNGDKGHMYYLVEEFVEGTTLAQDLKQWGEQGLQDRPKSYFGEVVDIFFQLSKALCYIHALNKAHLDVKPQNIIREKPDKAGKRRVVLTDFTNARRIYGNDIRLQGSILYQAPEQVDKNIGATKADIWASGVILYQCLTNQYPFETSQPDWSILSEEEAIKQEEELRENIRKRNLKDPMKIDSAMPPELAQICRNMLSKYPHDRPQTKTLQETFGRLTRRLKN